MPVLWVIIISVLGPAICREGVSRNDPALSLSAQEKQELEGKHVTLVQGKHVMGEGAKGQENTQK